MNEVVDLSFVFRYEIYPPKTTYVILAGALIDKGKDLPSVTVASREAHETICKLVLMNERAKLAA